MAQEAPSPGYKAWFEKQAQLQEDGTYLVRPWGYWSGVYQIDETTKHRWIAFRMAGLWLGGIAGLLIVVLKGDAAWGAPRVILSGAAALVVLLTVSYGGLFVIFHRAQRVPKERWTGPAVVDRWGVVSRGKWLRSAIGLGVVTLFWAWWSLLGGPPGSLWQSVPFLLFFAAVFLLSLFGYWRARQRPGEPVIVWPTGVTRPPGHRTWLAILIAPSGTALLLLAGGWLGQMMIADGSQHGPYDWSWLLWLVAISYALSYTAGIPVYLLARRRGWRSWQAYVGGSFLIGAVAVLLLGMVGLLITAATSSHLSAGALLGGVIVIGIFMQPVGLLFWLIARPDRPA